VEIQHPPQYPELYSNIKVSFDPDDVKLPHAGIGILEVEKMVKKTKKS
jgi:hypothetical protein